MRRPSRERFEWGGVTRLARLTGLDRLGVEVVGAVRPFGHVLQVCQGKGRTLAQAEWSALMEATELSAAEHVPLERLRFGAPTDSRWEAGGVKLAWVEGRSPRGERRLVPAQAVWCPPMGETWLGPRVVSWSSNGLGAHPTSLAKATAHACWEVLERDALATALPSGWTTTNAYRVVDAPAWTAGWPARGFWLTCVDLSPRIGPFVAAALLFDLDDSLVPLTAGYAARPTFAAALDAAVLEAAQSRLTEIHGAREDVAHGRREAGKPLLRALQRVRPQRWPRLARRFAVPDDVTVVTMRRAPYVVKALSPIRSVSELL